MILKMLLCVLMGAMLVGNAEVNETSDSVAIIGGADGPTSVFIAGKPDGDSDGLVLQTEEDQNGDISFLPLGVYLKPVSYENGMLTMVIDNQSGDDYYYGKEYMLQKQYGEEWFDVDPVEEYGWPKISLMVKDLETAYEVYDLTVFGELEAGTYKLVKNELEAEFTLMEAEESDEKSVYVADICKQYLTENEPEEVISTITNYDVPSVEMVEELPSDGTYMKVADEAGNGPYYRVTFTTTTDEMLGPIEFIVNQETEIVGILYRE